MQDIIERLNKHRTHMWTTKIIDQPVDDELADIIRSLKTLDQEHTRQTDELRGHRETLEEIRLNVVQARRKHNIWQDEISGHADDVAFLLTDLGNRLDAVTNDAAAARGVIESIRETARRGEDWDATPLIDSQKRQYMRDALTQIANQAANGLRTITGAVLRNEFRELEEMTAKFEAVMQETGGWTFGSDRTLARRVQRISDHYTRMAAQAVGDSKNFKDSVVSWLRGIAITAQAVSWATTHHEKDARLRGMIEVIETAITEIDKARLNDRLSSWNGVVDSWMKSDFPTREMRRRILDLEAEIKSLKAAQATPQNEPETADEY